MIRVAVVVRARQLRGALERGLAQRSTIVVVPFPVGGAAPSLAGVAADVVLVDLAEWSHGVAARAPRPAVIALADAPDEALIAAALRAGARGVLPYEADIAAVTAAVAAAAAGLVVRPAAERSAAAAPPQPPLTEREHEVLVLLAAGLPNREIGERLGISDQTVKTYVAAILDKLDAATRAEAVAIGLRRGLIML